MKNLHVIKSLFGCGLILCVLLVACSKDRVTQDSYQPMDAFYNANKQQEQVFTVDTGPPPCEHIGLLGTKLYNFCDSSMFIHLPDSAPITKPYQIGLVEIYSAKDMILWPAPSFAGSQLLETPADIRVRAFIGANNYVLRQGRMYEMTMNDSAANTNTVTWSVFDGTESTNNVAWATDPLSTLTTTPPLDSLNVFNMGWVNCARPHASTSSGVITVTVAGTGTQNIGIFIVYKNFRAVVKVNNLNSGPIPAGEPATFIAMAINQNNQYVLDQRGITTGTMTIALNMQPITESNLLATLAAL